MALNPAAYALTAQETLEKLDARRKFEKENNHLALPFPVEGLSEFIPPQHPGETAVILARSHEGKSTFLKSWMSDAEKHVTSKARRGVAVYVSLEDTAEISAEQQIARRDGNRIEYASSQSVYIGRSFGMSPDDMGELYMSNIARILEYTHREKFAEVMPFTVIGLDYFQNLPGDPERRKMLSGDGRRLQIADDVKRLCNAAVTYTCPIVAASQATLKGGYSAYSAAMPIPGPGDTDESKEIYQVPDRVYGLWHVARKYPPKTKIEDGGWSFESQDNLVFLWIEKFRYYQPNPKKDRFAPIGRVYPLFIGDRGNYYYDKEYHKRIYRGRVESNE